MRKISANYIFPVSSAPIKNGIIILDDNGIIIDIIDNKGQLPELSNLEFYNGIIVPGFISTHCHLELSYLKNKIKQKQGLDGFIYELISKRDKFSTQEIEKAAQIADLHMYKNGIVAVGDITNTAHTIPVKLKSEIYYHSFIEIFGSDNNIAKKVFNKGVLLKEQFEKNTLKASINPHAPYSVSQKLLVLFKKHYSDSAEIVSIHNQESIYENTMFLNGTGPIYDLINAGTDLKNWKPIKANSINYYMGALPDKNNKILVHNTFTSQEDIKFAQSLSKNIYWCLCPNANLFIEDTLPKINMFHTHNVNITIGTDSLASNNKLSILDELQTINNFFPEIPFNNLIEWATINGAKALEINKIYGSLEIGKKPGINLIDNFDFKKMTISQASTCKRII